MAVKKFALRENWVGTEVVGMKITFFAIFWPNLDQYLGPKYGIPYT